MIIYRDFIFGFICAFVIFKLTCEPSSPLTFNQLTFGNTKIHLHHWLISLFLLTFTKNKLLQGILFGGFVHGIYSYDDWHNIIYKV